MYDDGRTIVDMNVDGMPWYNPGYTGKKNDKDKPTFRERMAMIRGAYGALLPFVLCTVGAAVIVMLLISLWLH